MTHGFQTKRLDNGGQLGSLTRFFTSECTSEYVDLVDLLKRPEGKTLEFKCDLSAPDVALRTIVAFANTSGATLLVGVDEIATRFRVTLSTECIGPAALDETDQAILEALGVGKGLLTSEIDKTIGLTPRASGSRA